LTGKGQVQTRIHRLILYGNTVKGVMIASLHPPGTQEEQILFIAGQGASPFMSEPSVGGVRRISIFAAFL
jgi:hypothetical protein